jgi:hypothetical protein
MYFDDTTLTITITNTDFDEDKILILNGKERLKYFEDQYRPEAVLSPLGSKRTSLLRRMKLMLKK